MNDSTARLRDFLSTLDPASLPAPFTPPGPFHTATIEPLPIDASSRQYTRLTWDGDHPLSYIVMHDTCSDTIDHYVRIATWLHTHGLHSPRILVRQDPWCLIEDFGHNAFAHHRTPSSITDLYTLATHVLIHIAHHIPYHKDIPSFDAHLIQHEQDVFLKWYCGLEESCSATLEYQDIWGEIWAYFNTLNLPRCLVLKDFHQDNLFYVGPSYNTISSCGLIDTQDAVWGYVGYDLMSLLHDARADIPDDLSEHLIQLYVSIFPKDTHENLRQGMMILDIHRQLRILGVFARLNTRDHKPHYARDFSPRVKRYLSGYERLQDPRFQHLWRWIQGYISGQKYRVL